MDPIPHPQNLQEVEALIETLYSPGQNPARLSQIQEILQSLQKSAGGWKLAAGLLANQDDKIRFFGALTIVVKLNNESSTLSTQDAVEILQMLIEWLITALDQGSGAMALKKLCSALVTYFIHFSTSWHFCVRHLIYCLAEHKAASIKDIDGAPKTNEILGTLSPRAIQVALWFAGSLVEDANKTDINSPKYIPLHGRIVDNMPDLVTLLTHGMDTKSEHTSQEEALKCLQSWILYAQKTHHEGLVGPLRALVGPTILCLAEEHLYTVAVEVLSDTLTNYANFFIDEHYRQLFTLFESQWSREKYQLLLSGDEDFESVQFGLLMLSLGDAKMGDLLRNLTPQMQAFLDGLEGLLTIKGYPVLEDRVFVPAVDFWSTYAEDLSDSNYFDSSSHNPSKTAVQAATNRMMKVVGHCWRKIQFPPTQDFATWDSADRAAFGDARKDVGDILQSFYVIAGPLLVAKFVGAALDCLAKRSWYELEAAIYCISTMAEAEDERCDELLAKVFSSQLFNLLRDGTTEIPTKLRQTSLQLIERYSDFFERNSQYLASALNLLFMAVGDHILASSSSKTIHTLCSSCRTILTSEVTAFLNQYEKFASMPTLESIAEERIVGGITSIIQAIPDEDARLAAFGKIFSCIKAEAERAAKLANDHSLLDLRNPLMLRGYDPSEEKEGADSAPEVALYLALRALRCLGSAGRGMQAPSETVDLESAVQYPPEGTRLNALQDQIIGVISLLRKTFPKNGEVVEACCNIFKSGFCETDMGPFVLPPDVVVDFFLHHGYSTPRIGTVVSLAQSFTSSLKMGGQSYLGPVMAKLFPWIFELLIQLPEPGADVELAQNAIDFTSNLLSEGNIGRLMGVQPQSLLEFFFLFTLKVMESKEPLAKGAANTFWANFLQLRPTDATVKGSIHNVMEVLGPRLAQVLIQNIGGNCSRSEINSLCEPLKKFVVQDTRTQRWLEAALMDPAFPSHRVSPHEKSIFLKKIIGLRGAKATNQVVRDFWLACRGSSFAYVS
ncbi:hypothetical protein MKZ38_006038 [Zalerion maritima]|uniref:ARM repeat superfamily protein n=1 Tax=Zalerion maritima TaxID=339359 RepID=A0AAD5RPE0_9PEZI|nr:hypothetical protein MKZ38_006038 [Zalerion maritima]